MPPRITRKSSSTASKANTNSTSKSTTTSSSTDSAPLRSTGNPKVFLLPSFPSTTPTSTTTSTLHTPPLTKSTILTLPHPVTSAPARFLLHPTRGIHEIKKLSAPATVPQGWLVTPTTSPSPSPSDEHPTPETWTSTGQTVADASIYICTPIDPLFLVLPHLLKINPTATTSTKSSPPTAAPPTRFLLLDDILDHLATTSAHFSHLIATPTTSSLLSSRIKAISDTADAGGQPSYRVSTDKVLKVLVEKVERLARGTAFPRTVEDEFVKKVLARPGGEGGGDSLPKEGSGEGEGDEEGKNESRDPESEPTAETPTPPTPPEITHLLRLHLSTQLLSPYLTPALSALLTTHLTTLHDPAPLTAHLSALRKLKEDLTCSRAGDFSMKRALEHEEDGQEKRKRKKLEEEEEKKRKKKGASGAVRQLAKVDTKGMAKLTAFFGKKL